MTSNAPIQLPDVPVSASDLVGKALRIARLNWRVIVLPFVIPAFFYYLSLYMLVWSTELYADGYPTTAVSALAVSAFIMEMVTRFAVCIQTYAVQRMLLYNQPPSALRLSAKEAVTACFLGLPVVLLDLIMTVLMVAAVGMMTVATSSSDIDEGRAFLGLGFLFILFMLSLPFLGVLALHSFFTANFIAERMSLQTSISRFFQFLARTPGFFLYYMVIASCVYFAIEIATNLSGTIFGFIIDLFQPPTKDIVAAFTYTFDSFLMSPVYAMWFAGLAVTGACVQNQMTMALEGSDLRRRLKELETKVTQ